MTKTSSRVHVTEMSLGSEGRAAEAPAVWAQAQLRGLQGQQEEAAA